MKPPTALARLFLELILHEVESPHAQNAGLACRGHERYGHWPTLDEPIALRRPVPLT